METLTQRQTVHKVAITAHHEGVKAQTQPPVTNEMPIQSVAKLVPSSWVPYVQLMRLDRPGFLGFFMPTLMGLSAGATLADPPIAPLDFFKSFLFFWFVTNFIRGAACTWNDNLDQDFDRQVPRTRCRPIARGAVSTTQGHIFTLAQVAITAWILSHLPAQCHAYSLAMGVLHAIYPLCKRFMDFTPVFLGLPFSVTMILPAVGMGVDPFSAPAACLFMVEFIWTIIYETIYAHQDVQHDVQAGVKSMAVRYRHSTKIIASVLGVVMVGLMVAVGVLAGLSGIYFLVGCGGTALSLVVMIYSVDLTKPASCLYWFRMGFYIVGGSKSAGFLAQYLVDLLG
ncbi:para-hydroxybenzoate--polyprenyltransferase, mitochondrial precursor (PHB:polyprenyltransferase) [Aspergillus niger]|uniref:Para-hydroxybenzoate--polyprenyltransferase, mitochondrial (PHB:polyprenyltransferase) n=1 Tax=Aspergillus niger TaxID=5061 RepID=A0A9W6A8T9_ASPNG|nr:para-hydroxybenzoate--polyprenyltransferase, mitochondrial precursor (PHB:polyprenyltransferase) [Aspergillus niger]